MTSDTSDPTTPDLAAEGTVGGGGGQLQIRATLSDHTVDAALRLVTALAQETIRNADGVSVTLERHGRLMTVAATDDAVYEMDQHQYETGEGPCLAARADKRWFYIESLAAETRWPAFTPLALAQGINSAFSSPLMTGDDPQGALNLYSRTARAFSNRDQELVALFAARASDVLVAGRADLTEEQQNRRFADALETRATIARAEGVIMALEHVPTAAASAALHRAARAAELTVATYAAQIVASVHGDRGPS